MSNPNGKGSRPRPFAVKLDEFDERWIDTYGEPVRCGFCKAKIGKKAAEFCWYCHGYLCGDCWEERGHCGHPEADEINEAARRFREGS